MDNAAFDIDICRQCQHKDCRYCRFNPNNSIDRRGPVSAVRLPDNEIPGHESASVVVQNNASDEASAFKQFVRTGPCSGFDVDSGAADIQRTIDAIEKAGFVVVHKSDPTLRIIDKMYGTDYGQKCQPQD